MRFRFAVFVVGCALLMPLAAYAGKPKTCVSPDEAMQSVNKDVCVAAHVYDVVELPNGTRFLDVCTPDTPDARCRFTVISLREDRDTVGDLERLKDANVEIRGVVESMRDGRAGVILSHVRQFYGGPPKFRPNPRLARGFTGDAEKTPVRDPNLQAQGGRRAFMNALDMERKK